MKIMKTISVITMAAALIVLLGSCCGCRGGKSRTAATLPGTNWKLNQMDGRTLNTEGVRYTLTFTDDYRISGVGDCNTLIGGYSLTGSNGLKIDGAASTRMFCLDQQTEDMFVRLVSSADSYRIDGNMLMLFQNGETTLVFSRQ